MKIRVCKEFEFHAAHHLPNYEGKCREVHGHSYVLEVEVGGHIDPETGMVCDFAELKRGVENVVISAFDHANLNQMIDLPTAENTIKEIVNRREQIVPRGTTLERIRLYETRTSFAEWRREDEQF